MVRENERDTSVFALPRRKQLNEDLERVIISQSIFALEYFCVSVFPANSGGTILS